MRDSSDKETGVGDMTIAELEALANSDDAEEQLAKLGEDGAAGEETYSAADEDAARAAAESGEEAGSESANDDASKAEGEGGGEAGDDTAAAGQDDDQGKPAGVLTRDGKHTIPFSVLEHERRVNADLRREMATMQEEHERRANADLRREMATMQEELRALQQDAASGQEGEQGEGAGTTDTGKILDLETFKEEYGEDMAKPFEALLGRFEQLQGEIAKRDQRIEAIESRTEAEQATSTQEAIDLVFADHQDPQQGSILRHWQQNDPAMWEAAKAVDTMLLDDADWQSKPDLERFEEVVRRLGHAPSTTPQPPNNSDTKPAGAKKGATGGEGDQEPPARRLPHSQSGLTGGTPPDQTLDETVERMSAVDLEAKFSTMTPDQMEEFLARL